MTSPELRTSAEVEAQPATAPEKSPMGYFAPSPHQILGSKGGRPSAPSTSVLEQIRQDFRIRCFPLAHAFFVAPEPLCRVQAIISSKRTSAYSDTRTTMHPYTHHHDNHAPVHTSPLVARRRWWWWWCPPFPARGTHAGAVEEAAKLEQATRRGVETRPKRLQQMQRWQSA